MLGKNVDFIAVLVITLVMLGLNWVRSSHWVNWSNPGLDSIRVADAINVQRCPLTLDLRSSLAGILHR
jgi:hypothetical protein